ncbi:MAG: GTP cyclohydrolase I [Candidatus Parvarchaeum sp.]
MSKIISIIISLMNELEKSYGWTFTEEEKKNTPERISRMLNEWQTKNTYEKFTSFENAFNYNELITVKNIDFMAFCSHHLLPFFGQISIAYLPNDKVIGASKLARIVEKFAYKAQLQERLTEEIANFLFTELQPTALLVHVEAVHTCMTERGVNKINSKMITNAIRGDMLKNSQLRSEALEMIKNE